MYRVIIVDDEPLIRISIRKRVDWDRLGLSVVGMAGNGREALDLIEQNTPDIVLVDIRMPVMDGLAMVEEANRRGLDHIQFVIISGYNDFAYARQAIRLGVCDYIQKPVDESELEATLGSIVAKLDEHSAQAEGMPVTAQNSKDDPDVVCCICRYIDNHYDQALSLTAIADLFHINSSYLSQLFKLRSGQRLTEYIESVRIDKSRSLLERSGLSVIEIAARVGYNDPNYFSKVFRKNVGLTPSQYQHQHTSRHG